MPAPPTFSFAMQHMGRWAEEQPPDPTEGREPDAPGHGRAVRQGRARSCTASRSSPITGRSSSATSSTGEGKVIDIYEKETDTAVMTFVVVETAWRTNGPNEPVVTERFNLIGRTRKG